MIGSFRPDGKSPAVLTAYSIDAPNTEVNVDENENEKKIEKDKKTVLICLVVYNGILLLTLVFLYLIPIYEKRNCLSYG